MAKFSLAVRKQRLTTCSLIFYFLNINAAIISQMEKEMANAPHSSTLALENPMDGGAWQAAVHGVVKNRTRLSDFTFTFNFHALEKEMATHSSVLAWRIPGTGSLVGCCLWGLTGLGMTEVTSQQQQQQQQQHFLDM